MGGDSDHFDDDIFGSVAANNNARAGGRFQPRGKRGPIRKQPSAIASASSQPCLENVSSVSVPNEEYSKPYEDKCAELLNPLELVTNQERVSHTVESLAESNALVTGQSSGLEKSVGENADIASPYSTTEAPAIPVSQNIEDGFALAISSSSGSPIMLSKKAHDLACPESSPVEDPLTASLESPLDEDPLTGGHPIVSVSEGSSLMHDGRLESKQVELDPCLESLDIPELTSYGPWTGKFQPKNKIHEHEARSKVCTPNPDVGQSGVWENEHLDLPVVQNTLSECQEDDVLDLSSLGFDHSVPLEPTSQLPSQKMSQAEPAPHEGDTETVCDTRGGMGTRGAKANQQTASTSRQQSRPRRKCDSGRQLVDEPEDEVEPNDLSEEPGEHLMDRNGHKEVQVDNKTQEKKSRKGFKKPVLDKEKPVRTRKKAGETTNQATGTTTKKFPHSTRQKKRRVDQVLLDTPEDEIEFQKVPLRDLIILAEYKERMTKKPATTSQVPSTGQSNGSTHNNEYEGDPSEQVEVTDDTLFNYQTYMEKTPSTRWSKQDTELFYQAVQQFGTDLSMIQQLFPGRTRRQVKLKYKKEERQHPLRLREALTNRPNDYSHFKHVIEHLQKVAAEDQQTASKDESIDLVDDDEEAEQMQETTDEAAKFEPQVEQVEANDLEAEVPVKSPPVSYETEEDWDFDFSQYKSEV